MANTYSKIYLHYVFSPKYRQALIRPEFEEALFLYIGGIVINLDQQIIAINGMPDHCHLLVRMRPTMTPSKLIQVVKANSSKWINENRFLPFRFNWQVGCGIFSVDHHALEKITRYIENQKEHHKKDRFRHEYESLLRQYNIDYDNTYLFDFFD
jgi:REP element-mobilizing transposase RayT